MTPPRVPGAELQRRTRLAWGVCSHSARYLARNAAGMGWRDLALVSAATAALLALALFAPDYLSGNVLRERTPHAPVDVE